MIFYSCSLSTGWAHSVLFSADLKHLQQLKTENSDVQNPKSSHIKEETLEDSKKYVKKKKVKEETHDGPQKVIKEEVDDVKSGTVGDAECKEEVPADVIEAVKTKTEIKNSTLKAKCKPVKKLKSKASPSVGEISPFRRKKLKT